MKVTELQTQAYELLMQNQKEILATAETEICVRTMSLERKKIAEETTLAGIYFSRYQFVEGREFSLLFDSPLEPELGLAIRFRNEKIDRFGTQDDVL
jgi:hypothetical protein